VGSPYLTIWTEPRRTIREIVDRNPRYRVIFLIVLGAEVSALGGLKINPPPAASELFAFGHVWRLFQLAMLVLSPPLAIISLYLGAVLMRWAGGVIGGVATAVEVRAAMAWATIPSTVAAAIYTVALTTGMVRFEVQVEPPGLDSLRTIGQQVGGLQIAVLILGLWGFVIWLKCMGEVHRFSAWKALGASMIAVVSSIAAIIALAVAMSVAAMLFLQHS
jgi:Yip1 domain